MSQPPRSPPPSSPLLASQPTSSPRLSSPELSCTETHSEESEMSPKVIPTKISKPDIVSVSFCAAPAMAGSKPARAGHLREARVGSHLRTGAWGRERGWQAPGAPCSWWAQGMALPPALQNPGPWDLTLSRCLLSGPSFPGLGHLPDIIRNSN